MLHPIRTPGTVELSLTLVDDEVIREVNAEFRGVDAPTDVLSFEMGSDEGEDDSPKARRGWGSL